MGNVNMEAKQIHDRTEAGKRQSVAEHLAALDAVAKKIDDMPTYTSVDRAFLDEWETNLPILANDVSNLGTTKANQITIAPFFNAETAYDPGDIVYYNGLSYRCVNAHEGEWDADDFAATTIDNELSSLNSNLNGVSTYTDCKGTSQASSLEYIRAVYNSTTKIVDVGGYITDVSFVQGLTVIDQVVTPTGRPIIDIAVSVFTTESATVYAYITTSGNLAVHSDAAFSGSLFLSGVYTVG